MQQKSSNGLLQLGSPILRFLLAAGYSIMGLVLFVWIGVRPFEKGYPEGPIYYLLSAALLLLSTLLFYLLWRAPRGKLWDRYRVMFLATGTYLAASYPAWFYARAWGLPPVWGLLLGLVAGLALGAALNHWEEQAISARRGVLVADQEALQQGL